ncbi:MAG: hypothetical protein EON59_04030 [Alphaproteobacteria bacterium]|nr:MAG: hypothetical protein EON59_04030 [Alphaproteobacteria bacterium]
MTQFIAAYWPWLVAYPFVGAFLFGFAPNATSFKEMAMFVIAWPLIVVMWFGMFFGSIFR